MLVWLFVGIEVGAGRDGKATMIAEITMTENIPPGDEAEVGAEAETTTAAAPEATMTTMMTMINIVTGRTGGGEIIECHSHMQYYYYLMFSIQALSEKPSTIEWAATAPPRWLWMS